MKKREEFPTTLLILMMKTHPIRAVQDPWRHLQMQMKTQGIVLKQRPIGENDRILTILSGDLGLIEVTARNVKSTRSTLGGASQILSYCDFCLYKGKNHYIVNSAEPINSFYSLRLDVVKLSLAGYFCEIMIFLCGQNDDGAGEMLKLMLNTLHFLQDDSREERQLKCIFELRSMTISGFMPDLVGCCGCGEYEKDQMMFFPTEGRIICLDCYNKGNMRANNMIFFKINPAILSAMRFIIFSQPSRIFGFRLTGESLKKLSEIAEDYVKLHIDARFNSLNMYKSLIALM